MPGPYQPSRQRAPQAQPTRRLTRRQVLWLSPLVALLPIAVVLAANAVTQSGVGAGAGPAGGVAVATVPPAAATPLAVVVGTETQAPAGVGAEAVAMPATGAATAPPAAAVVAGGATATAAGSATAVVAEPPPTQANPPYVAYTVQPGDTVASVAQRYGVPAASVAQASGLRDAGVLHPGQVLTVPRVAGWLYRVQPGETLDQIAARMGVPAEKIAEASSQQAASIRPGYVLLIPDQPAPDTAK